MGPAYLAVPRPNCKQEQPTETEKQLVKQRRSRLPQGMFADPDTVLVYRTVLVVPVLLLQCSTCASHAYVRVRSRAPR